MGRPAYSSAFTPDTLQTVPASPLNDRMTRDWAWGGSSGQGVKVAIIDSGVDSTHPAVGPVQGYVAFATNDAGEVVKEEGPHEDLFGHGTACAGLIRSIAPECEIHSVRVLGAKLGGSGAVFAAGLRWCVENGMQVCNLSLGTTKRDFYALFHELVDQAYFRNVLLVTAANNLPFPSFPSVYSSVIAVGSHASLDDPYLFYYNPRPPVEFGAPGINVRVPWLEHKWITGTGNSYATPHITAIVTRILAKHPGLTAFQMKSVLRAVASNVAAAEAGVRG
jgi:subtilisin